MTAAAEIAEQLGGIPDVVTLPYGGGGNTRAIARGFEELVGGLPRLHPVEAAQRPDTVASAIRIVEPVHAAWVQDAIERSGGSLITVTDEEILTAWKDLRTLEGVFSEPASAAGIAGLAHGSAAAGERVVSVVTGHGLKDPAAIGE
jgi:threonine synthase